MQVGANGPRGEGMTCSILWVRGSKVNVTRGHRQIWRPGGGIFLDAIRSSSLFSFIYIRWEMTVHSMDYICARPQWPAEALCSMVVRPSVRPFVTSVTKLVNSIFWKRMNGSWCKLAQVACGTRSWNDQLLGSTSRRSRSHEADVRFRGLAEASFWTRLGRVGF